MKRKIIIELEDYDGNNELLEKDINMRLDGLLVNDVEVKDK